ncbi:hypothetical protein SNE40_003388 [Patella caerulea]|uniref:Uncharacterized protein n=1 Tax=Patella caerulea TaxID=87958 RepID=A0AAN8QF48_PATCE
MREARPVMASPGCATANINKGSSDKTSVITDGADNFLTSKPNLLTKHPNAVGGKSLIPTPPSSKGKSSQKKSNLSRSSARPTSSSSSISAAAGSTEQLNKPAVFSNRNLDVSNENSFAAAISSSISSSMVDFRKSQTENIEQLKKNQQESFNYYFDKEDEISSHCSSHYDEQDVGAESEEENVNTEAVNGTATGHVRVRVNKKFQIPFV